MSTLPDYYAFLNVSPTATTDEIRQAYKRESLKCVQESKLLLDGENEFGIVVNDCIYLERTQIG